ncbi:metal-dependent transcriptional regulator [Phytohabitans suffuscus]|uniref:DtxR family transcriptional regulator n=1 Tax=Phytohabitans suffuscus TaxID=624315 RepID=A0A6F8YTX5_9ACTN|nr:metal-dependent transcriptional regulator [Phytohabitans suffuscus]BCB89600.1 DtxR family transcriptional regulator [Phytohabitans suffuscus]
MGYLGDVTGTYLRIVLELEEDQVVPRRARVAERVPHSMARVNQVTARLVRAGLVVVLEDRRLALTEAGRAYATAVMRRHRLAEAFLVDIVGVAYEDAHAEACRWQHVLSVHAERRIYHLLGRPSRSPYGNPIPGLATLGAPPSAHADVYGEQTLLAFRLGGEVTVSRIGEGAQRDAGLLRELRLAGVGPGARMTATWVADGVLVTGNGTTTYLSRDTAALLFVVAGRPAEVRRPR